MNASKQIIEVLDAIGNKELIEKYVRYVVVNKILLIIISLLVFVAIGVFATKCAKQYKKASLTKQSNLFWAYDPRCLTPIVSNPSAILGITLSVVSGVVFITVFVMSVVCLIKCFTIPELAVFDYIKSLLSST